MIEEAVRRGTRVAERASNWVFVAGLNMERVDRSMAWPGLELSSIMVALLGVVRDLAPRPTLSKRSWACFRSASCSLSRSRVRFSASSSSSDVSSSSSSAALLRRAASLCSSILCALDFLLAAASASAAAFAAAAFAAFSRSTSESSASSQLSAT